MSFVGAMLRSLTSDLANVIYLMLRQACPDALGRGDTLHQLQSLRHAFHTHHHNPPEEQFSLHIYNQDLSGFFTSISTDRFLASLHLMTHWYKNKSPNHATTFTCTHHEPDPTMRVHRGRSRFQKPRRHTIHLNHLPDICQAVLLLNYCMVGNTLLQQTRGAPMGSPASPALCDMVVAECEQSWSHTYRNITYNVKHCHTKQFTLSGFFATRYVDNRLTLLPTRATHLSHFLQFLSPHFYGAPIFLETEPGLDYLGFTINPSQHAIHYKATANLTDILSPQSASPDIVLRSSFRARAILARRLATPQEAVAQAMEQLSEVYKTAGYDQSWIRELCKESTSFCRGPNPLPSNFLSHACLCYIMQQIFSQHQGNMHHRGGKLLPLHKVMPRPPVGAPREPIARRRHRSRSPPQTVYAAEVPQTSGLRHQLLRVAQAQDPQVEKDDNVHQDDDTEGVPLPKTPPFPPPHQADPAEHQQPPSSDTALIFQRIEALQQSLAESNAKAEALLNTTNTLLATQHEASTALLASCKQQLDIIVDLLRVEQASRSEVDWS